MTVLRGRPLSVNWRSVPGDDIAYVGLAGDIDICGHADDGFATDKADGETAVGVAQRDVGAKLVCHPQPEPTRW